MDDMFEIRFLTMMGWWAFLILIIFLTRDLMIFVFVGFAGTEIVGIILDEIEKYRRKKFNRRMGRGLW